MIQEFSKLDIHPEVLVDKLMNVFQEMTLLSESQKSMFEELTGLVWFFCHSIFEYKLEKILHDDSWKKKAKTTFKLNNYLFREFQESKNSMI